MHLLMVRVRLAKILRCLCLPVIDLGGTAERTFSRTSVVTELSVGESLRGPFLDLSVDISILRVVHTSSTPPTL